jgi:hypothetical protein
MPTYMALLYDSPTEFADLSPQEMQAIIEKYRAWSTKMYDKGIMVGGQKLKDGEGRVLHAPEGKLRILDGPYSETKEIIGGYFALQADSYDEVVKILADCPHLQYGGKVEVREFDSH